MKKVFSLFLKPLVLGIKYQDIFLTKIAIKLMYFLGRSERPIHPKHLYDKERNIVLENLIKREKTGNFLDLGSGTGTDILMAAKLGWSCFGVEYEKKNIDIIYTRLRDLSEKLAIISNHNLEHTPYPFESNFFTIINFTNVLEHLNNRSDSLKEVRRLLSDNGICLISIPNKNTLWKKIQRFSGIDSRDDRDHKIEYSINEIQNEIKGSGLRIKGKMQPIVPSFPLNGLIACSAIFSPKVYVFLQKVKRDLVKKNYVDTVGWVFECVKN